MTVIRLLSLILSLLLRSNLCVKSCVKIELIDSEVFVVFYISAMVCVLWTDIIVFS